ncbi:MAG: PEP-CTERM sorting domain-containing protein, partial [Microcystis sp.]
LTGQTFSGTFSYDNSLLTGLGFEFLDVSQVNLNFLGSTFTALNADSNPTVEFLDGILLGLNFSTSSFTPEFSLIPASGSTEATFSYIGINDSGSGPVQYVLIPEPSTVLGIIALGIGGFLVGRKR